MAEFLSELNDLTFTNPKTKSICKIQFKDTQLRILPESEDEKKAKSLSYDDIIGVKLCSEPSESATSPTADVNSVHSIEIYSYPSSKTLFSSKSSRKRSCLSLLLNCDDVVKREQVLQSLYTTIQSHIGTFQFMDF